MTNDQKPLDNHIEDNDLEKVAGGGRELPPQWFGASPSVGRIKPHGRNRAMETPDLEPEDRLV